MRLSIAQTSSLILTMALLISQNAMAFKVYQWTDEEGVVHYSDTPPGDDASSAIDESSINEIEMINYVGNSEDSDKYSIVNQLEQMIAWRRQEEEDRRAWKQLQLEEERQVQEQQAYQPPADDNSNTYYVPAYYPQVYAFPYSVNAPRYTNRHGHRFPDTHMGFGRKASGFDRKAPHGQFTRGFYKLDKLN